MSTFKVIVRFTVYRDSHNATSNLETVHVQASSSYEAVKTATRMFENSNTKVNSATVI